MSKDIVHSLQCRIQFIYTLSPSFILTYINKEMVTLKNIKVEKFDKILSWLYGTYANIV